MPADKDAAKRRRQARNRQERAARQARTEGAKRAATRPARTAAETPPVSMAKTGRGKSRTAAAPGKDGRPSRTLAGDEASTTGTPSRGGLLGSLFPPRPQPGDGDAAARPAGRPVRVPSEVVDVDVDAGPRGTLQRWMVQPGGRTTVLAFIAAVVLALTLLVLPVVASNDLAAYGETVVEAQTRADADADATDDEVDDAVSDAVSDFETRPVATVRALELRPPQVYVVVLGLVMPILLTVAAVRSLVRPTRSRTLLYTALGTGMIAFIGGGGLPLILVAGLLGWSAWQSSKFDKAAAAAA